VQGKDGALEVGGASTLEAEPQYCLITLLREGQDIVAVAAVITRCLNLERAKQRLLSMQLVAGYFEFFSLRKGAEINKMMAQNHQRVLQLSRSVADAEGFLSAAMNLCNELANATGATRVSLGWLKGRLIRVKALSHTEEFDKKQELIVQLEKAMEECFDQEQMVLFDPSGQVPGNDAVTRQAAALSRGQGGHVVLSLPLRRRAEIEGVVTLEFLSGDKINPKILESLTISMDLLAPQLYDRHENDHWLITKVGISARRTAEELLGPQHWVAKLITFGVILLLMILTNFLDLPVFLHLPWIDIRPTYHVTAPITFEALDKRSLCAPFDGQIDQVLVKPGKWVPAGTTLFTMNTDELRKQKAKSDSEALSHKRKADAYAADSTKIADELVELAQADEATAQSKLYQSQIDRAVIKAPFAGEVLKGDLSDKKDVPVKEGEEQMVFGRPDNLHAALLVNERDIQDIAVGERGSLATTSKPSEKYKFTIDRVDPLGVAKEGSNVFTVYATLDQTSPSWRPGMAGEARVDIDKRTWAWIWTHRLIEFVRLKTWL
jgi:biotin carboxyl carrier protein